MAHYRFTLSNYHAIHNADIKLDGITVIAGCNGSGKSTIARWLYAFVNYSNRFSELVDQSLIQKFNLDLNKIFRIVRNIDHRPSYLRQFASIRYKKYIEDELDYQDLIALFKSRVSGLCEKIGDAVEEDGSSSFNSWIKQALSSENDFSEDYISEFYERMVAKAKLMADEALDEKQERRYGDLLKFIRKDLDLCNDVPESMFFEENGHNLISENKFIIPIGLRNAIYIDTPMALSTHNSSDNVIWDKMMEALTTPMREAPSSAIKLATRIRRIIGGQIVVREDEFSSDKDIRYIRKQDNLDISIDEAATGLKSFAYMLRLIENGYLDSDSILLIDEPEAHLHPQWIVEFARVLVLLQKEVGTKILIASHNPDMVAAIQSISKAEGIEDVTSFYQADKDEGSLRYTYKYLGNDIDEIFRSFNIALERIKDYGC